MGGFLKDLLFPPVCLSCGFLGSHICIPCANSLKKVEKDLCFYCKRPSYLGLTHPFCKKKQGVDGFITSFYYDNRLKKILKNIKYRLVTSALPTLLSLVPQSTYATVAHYNKLYKNLAISEIPLYVARKRLRGFNQSEIIADFFSSFFSFPRAQNLVKTCSTKSQSQTKTKKERRENVRGVFEIDKRSAPLPRHVLLIDDVTTSGATLEEACKTLKKDGTAKVVVFTLAKG